MAFAIVVADGGFQRLDSKQFPVRSELDSVRGAKGNSDGQYTVLWNSAGHSVKLGSENISVDFWLAGKQVNSETPISSGRSEVKFADMRHGSKLLEGSGVRRYFVTHGPAKEPFDDDHRAWVALLQWSTAVASGARTEAESMSKLASGISGLNDQGKKLLSWEDEGRFATSLGFDPWNAVYTDVPGLLARFKDAKSLPVKTNCYSFAGILQASSASLGINSKVRMFSGNLRIQPGIAVVTDGKAPAVFGSHTVVVHDGLITDANLCFLKDDGRCLPVANLPWAVYLDRCFGLDAQSISHFDYVPRPVHPRMR